MILRLLFFFVSVLFLSGCQKIPMDPNRKLHSLNVQWDGKPWQILVNEDGDTMDDFSENVEEINREIQKKIGGANQMIIMLAKL